MKNIYGWVLCTFLGGIFLGMPMSVLSQPLKPTVPDSILDTALWTIGLTQADLSIRGDILGDVDRLALTQQVLEEPTRAMMLLPEFNQMTGVALLQDALQMMDHDTTVIDINAISVVGGVPQALNELILALAICQKKMDVIFEGVSAEEKNLFMSMIYLVDPGMALSEAKSDSLIALGRRIDRRALVMATIELMKCVDEFVASPPALEVGTFDTPIGRVIVGGVGKDVYSEPVLLLIDLGGNDHYVCQSDSSRLSVVIDLGGDDFYEGAFGSGIVGVGLIVDVQGQDRYISGGIGQGAGVGGVGVLIDLGGDDFYQADVGGQGFGLYGVGILCDRAGDDEYVGALLVQGVGAPGGVGILADALGVDTYRAGGKYKDFREAGQYYQSMAQGFGYGVRPLASGGVGVLVDGDGDDRYQVDYFGQGVGFWGSVGVLIDRQGKDQYQARRYAQGCGVHLAVGLLVDHIGDDIYMLWG
ncbi:MAG: hypothetical protein HN521_18665, partial [Candidatus Latescibacteria bacterium]|nr:hypothetical protein [Candidatus Latescibacterota bacterium]